MIGNSNFATSKQIEHDPTPLYRAAKELINMQMDSGEFPQQVRIEQILLINQFKFVCFL